MEDSFFKKRLSELAGVTLRRGICSYTDFLNPEEQSLFFEYEKELPGVGTRLWGGFPEAERRMLCFYEEASCLEPDFPVMCLIIEPLSIKFSEHLTHRDYLGAVLNLGIDRSKTGDLLVEEHRALLVCQSRIGPFLTENISRVKHTPAVCRIGELAELVYEPVYKPVTGFVSSVRLDSVLAVAFQGSRSSLSGLIPAKKVFINGRPALSGHLPLKEEDRVSVRGLGKFIYKGMTNQTKKGRYVVTIWLLQ